MNYHVLLIFLLLSIGVRAQKEDTIFIENNKFQKIYIEKNKNSNHYKSISDFTDFKNLGKSNSKWIQIHAYKGEYFLYYPCDQVNDLKYVIDIDQIQIKYSEIVAYKIISLKKRGQNTYIKYQEPNSGNKILLKIIPVNMESGIYKFITFIGNQQYEKIMLESSKYKNYNLIVNECTENKSSELDFGQYKK
ncbi:hypothetical protein [Chryseobacterium taichungense]|uniref:hypothetical protein n=1 Tax=Chryseobacterium taichungense TaxID=295069 RepID=UPI0028A75DAC|nr:hypothetical protein [Chryseobacterium taichungense]